MVADDLAVMSRSSYGLQRLVFEAKEDASRERYTYNVTKTKSQVVGTNQQILKAKEDMFIHLNGILLNNSNRETHVGTERTADGLNGAMIEARISLA